MMNLYKFPLIIALLLTLSCSLYAATGEVTRSGSTWTTKVDGSTKYTGSDMIDAINAACSNMGAGTIHVRNSGDAVAPNGLRSVNINSNQTIDFHDNTMNCQNPLNIYPVKGYKKSNVSVKNLNVTGVPRYILHFSGCNGVTLTDITAHTTRGTGIRVENGSNLVINGNINLHSPGHCIETMVVDGVDIGTVTVQADKGCGVLLNTSTNCNIDAIYAYNCDYGQSYAGFRQANNNGKTYLGYLYARHCGRGLYTLSGSNSVTVNKVDIDDCSESGISSATTASGVRVNSGTVTNSNKNIDIWNGATDICIKVNGQSYGDACSSGGGGSSSFYSMTSRNSNKCVEVAGGSSSNNANVQQNACNSSSWRQNWELIDAGSSYLLIKNRNSGKCLRTVNGNIVQYDCNNTYWSEQFSRQNLGGGFYLIKSRQTGQCLRVENSSSSNGASIVLDNCNSSMWSEQFSFSSAASRTAQEVLTEAHEVQVYPNPATERYTIQLMSDEAAGAYKLYNTSGKVVLSEVFQSNLVKVDVNHLSPGMYLLEVESAAGKTKQKLTIK